MRKDLEAEAPRLGWAVVRERAADDASGHLPELPRVAPGSVPDGPADPGEPYRLVPVSAWSHLPPRSRPASFCPVCLSPVTLKLGNRNRHHYAHAPDSTCAAASGEGALHLAAKLLLAQLLGQGGDRLRLRRICARVPGEVARTRCPTGPLEDLSIRWDGVEVERALPSLRADLILTLRGRPVLAIEVRATHAVDERKSAALADLRLPWIEVEAARLLPPTGAAWHAEVPLPVLVYSGATPAAWRCEYHTPLYAAFEERRLNGVHRLAWRIVHLYRRDAGIDAGRHRAQTILLSIFERRFEGRTEQVWLERDDREEPLCDPLSVRSRDEALDRMHQEFRSWVRRQRALSGAGVDSPMRWTDGAPPAGVEATRLYPQRYRLDSGSGRFVAPPGIPAFAWPLPLLAEATPHPIFGDAPVAWRDDGAGDGTGDAIHAVVAPLWLTLRPISWTNPAGEPHLRVDLTVHRHDGSAWIEITRAGSSHSYRLAPGAPDPDWKHLTLRLAERSAESAEGRDPAARPGDLLGAMLPSAPLREGRP